MAEIRPTTRRALLMGAGAIAGAAILTESPGQSTFAGTGTSLDRARLATLANLQHIARQHPSTTAARRHDAARRAPGADMRRLQSRYQRLDADHRRAVRHGADWWRGHVDLATPSRAQDTLAIANLDQLERGTVSDVLAACSIALADVVPGLSGANNSVAALWLSGLTKNGALPWHRG